MKNRIQITLRAARVNAGKTQKQLANELNVSVNTYIKWEQNPDKIPASIQGLLSEFLGISIDNIIFLPRG